MRLAGLAMLVALAAGGASAQPDPTRTKPEITQNAEDAVKTGVSELGKDMKRDVRALQDDVQSEAERDGRADGGGAARNSGTPHVSGKVTDPAVKPCKDCIAPTKPH